MTVQARSAGLAATTHREPRWSLPPFGHVRVVDAGELGILIADSFGGFGAMPLA